MSVTPLYNEFPSFLKRYFPYKVQKISLNAGFTCPNRDGNKGYGGCTYCNNQTFNPDYCRTEKPISLQLEEGKRFFAHKYPEMRYLAYFQAYQHVRRTGILEAKVRRGIVRRRCGGAGYRYPPGLYAGRPAPVSGKYQ